MIINNEENENSISNQISTLDDSQERERQASRENEQINESQQETPFDALAEIMDFMNNHVNQDGLRFIDILEEREKEQKLKEEELAPPPAYNHKTILTSDKATFFSHDKAIPHIYTYEKTMPPTYEESQKAKELGGVYYRKRSSTLDNIKKTSNSLDNTRKRRNSL